MALTKINASVIANNTIAVGNIADNSVDATKIASNSILTRHIDDDQITGDQLADNISIAGTLASGGDLTVEADGAEIYLKSADYNVARIIPRGTSADLDKGLLSLFDAGTEDVRIDTAGNSWFNGGNVGIGTTSPQALMDISSAATSTLRLSNSDTILAENQITGQLEFYQADATTGGTGITGKIGMRSVPTFGGSYYGNAADMDFYVSGQANGYANDNASLTAMTIQAASGNVGIGTTSPSVPLHINSTSAVSNRLAIFESDINNTNEYSTISVGHNQLSANFGLMLTTSDTAYVGVGTSGNAFDPTTGTGLYVNANGNVGIGTASPATTLHLDASGGAVMRLQRISANASNKLEFSHDGTDGTITSTNDLILSAANVGIGTTSPATKLHIADTGGIELRLDADTNNNGQEDCFIKFSTDGGTQVGLCGMDNNNSSTLFSGNTENAMVFGTVSNLPTIFATNNTERLHITSGGDISIGVTKKFSFSSDEDTYITEDAANQMAFFTGGGKRFALIGGAGYFSGTVTASHNFSDERLKENIVVIPNALEKINTLRGITFTRKSDGSSGTGLIAQELEKVLPDAVYESKTMSDDDDTEYKAITYEVTVGLLVEGIKELKTKLEAAEARIKTLEG